MLRTRAAARAALIIALALVVLPGLHPDDRAHRSCEPGVTALSSDLEGFSHDPDCALCRMTSQVRTALHDPAGRHAQAASSTGPRLGSAADLARSAPSLRGPRARAPPSA